MNTKAQPATADTIKHTKDAPKEHRYVLIFRVFSFRSLLLMESSEASDGVAVGTI